MAHNFIAHPQENSDLGWSTFEKAHHKALLREVVVGSAIETI